MQRYDDLAPPVEAHRRTGAGATAESAPLLRADQRHHGHAKYLPVTRAMLSCIATSSDFSVPASRACPAAFDGGAFGVMVAATGPLDSGHTVGPCRAALRGASRPAPAPLVVPPEVAEIETRSPHDVMLLLALASRA